MIIKGTVNVEIDSDQVENIIVDLLKKDYTSLARDVSVLVEKANRGEAAEYELLDLKHDLSLMKAMDYVLANYMIYSDHQQFRRTWKKYVDLYIDADLREI